ncbi:lipopolysaccharide biosynthesis protein [Noviherbaspirillum aridicola]|uniref:O-antigen/teichoic acid export membrane protein n=1 Tax=Noviherbaspirillum aridicola TaxID=2849687 RepID=A0ABQ4Q5N0_9BURK|nr:lipopolysaccharide biosynthesis protein [Noviherbaspirillum aridicola]GIZ52508.1 hypothetical protein NCCP691_25220 [Noviherbaspirillum aridicola]
MKARHFVHTAVSIGSRLLSSLVLFVLLARLLGPTDFGHFTFAFGVSVLAALIVDFGFAGFLLREVGVDASRAAALVQTSFWAKLWLAAVYAVSAAVLLPLAGDAMPLSLTAPLFVAAGLASFADFFIAPLRGMARYAREAAIVTSSNVMALALGAGAALAYGTPQAVAWALLAARAVYLVIAWRAAAATVAGFTLAVPSGTSAWQTLSRVWPYGVDGMLTTAWSQLDVVLVRLLFGAQAVGLYAAGQKIVQGAASLIPVIGNVMIPSLSRMVGGGAPGMRGAMLRTVAALAACGVVFGLPLLLFPVALAVLLYGAEFAGVGHLLPVFGALLIVRFAAAGTGIVATASGFQKKRVAVQIGGMAAFLALVAVVWVAGLEVRAFIGAYIVAMAAIGAAYARLWWKPPNERRPTTACCANH